MATIFLAWFCQTYAFILIPLESLQASLSPAIAGLLVALPGTMSLFVDLPIASWSDARGRRPVLICGGAGLIATAVAFGGHEAWSIAIAAALLGVSAGLLAAPSLAALSEAASHGDQPFIQGWNGSVQASASIGAALTAGALFQTAPALAPIPLAVAGLGIAALALRSSEKPRREPLRLASSYVRAVRLFRSPTVRVVGLFGVAFGITFLVIGNAVVPLYLVSAVQFPPSLVGVALAVRPVVILIVSATFGRVVSQYGIMVPATVLTIIGAVGVAVVPLSDLLPAAIILAMALQGTGVAYSAAASNVLVSRNSHSHERAHALAATSLGSRLTLVVVAPMLGAVYEGISPALAFLVGSALLVLTAGAGWAERVRHTDLEGHNVALRSSDDEIAAP